MFESLRAHQTNQIFTGETPRKNEYHEYESGWADVLAFAQKISPLGYFPPGQGYVLWVNDGGNLFLRVPVD